MHQPSRLVRLTQFLAKFAFIAVITMATAMASLPLSDVSFAQGEAPEFNMNAYAAADGSSIQSAEAIMDVAYLGSNGTLSGLEVTATGLTLAAGSDRGTYTSPVISSPLNNTTDLVPFWKADLPDGASISVESRISDDGSTWSAWAESPLAYFPVRDGAYGGAMAWIGGEGNLFVQFQVTLSTDSGAAPTLTSFGVALNDASQGPSDSSIAAQLPVDAAAVCPAEKPTIVSRTQWGAPDGQNSPRWAPQTTNVTHLVVHHTGTPSSLAEWNRTRSYNTIGDWAAVVRSIWNFHANINGWGDVGYNYLIDPNGTIYEGRAGSQNGTLDIVGRADGVDVGGMGVAFIGCYGNCHTLGLQNAQPPQTMMNKGVELMAWKAGQRIIEPLGQGLYGGRLLPNIVAARDVYNTASPGDIIYNVWMSWLRNAVQDRVDCNTTPANQCVISDIVFDKAAYNLNDTIRFTAKLTDPSGNPLGGANVSAVVSIQEVSASATDSFNLINQVGDYDGVFSSTGTAGNYTFAVTANHPNYQSCSRSEVVAVGLGNAPTATPTPAPGTPTATPTPGPTPTPPPTPVPGDRTVGFDPSNLSIPSNASDQQIDVRAFNMPTVRGFDLTLRFDPNVVQVVDADTNQDGVQVRLGTQFRQQSNFVADNTVDNTAGIIRFATVLLSSGSVSGDFDLIEINFRPVAQGSFDLVLETVDIVGANAQAIEANLQTGRVEVVASSASLSGQLFLQGRDYHSGAQVVDASGFSAQSSVDGSFLFTNSEFVTLTYPGYLPARVEVQPRLAQLGLAADTTTANLGSVTMIAGDMDGNSVIDIFDLVYMANNYNSTDPVADINADGIVNILDLALVAGNYRLEGPVAAWE